VKAIALLALFTALASCKQKPSFEAEKEMFYREANARGCIVQPVDIYFARLDAAGYCVPNFGILIDETLWESFGPLQRREVVFHELAHCVFGAEHSKLGLMTPSMHDEAHLEAVWDTYVDLLFTDCLTFHALMDAINEKGGE